MATCAVPVVLIKYHCVTTQVTEITHFKQQHLLQRCIKLDITKMILKRNKFKRAFFLVPKIVCVI